MAHCPFCNAEVEQAKVTFGGTCQACFGEIPGEEAATDPGAKVRELQAKEDARRLRSRMMMPIIVASMVVLGIFATAIGLYLAPEPQMALLDLDDERYADLDVEFEVEEEPVEEPAKQVAKVVNRKGTGGSQNTGGTQNTGNQVAKNTTPEAKDEPKEEGGGTISSLDALRRLKVGNVADVKVGDTTTLGGPDVRGPRGTRAGSGDADIGDIEAPDIKDQRVAGELKGMDIGSGGTSVKRNEQLGVTLTDDNAIIEMVTRVLRTELRNVKTCYNQQLKANPDLRGSWVLTFTVGSDGKTKNIAATPKADGNEKLEQCLAGKINSWRFQPIKADLPVKKTVSFKPGY